jgi:nucleolar pre-ribosomal-associated protein 1
VVNRYIQNLLQQLQAVDFARKSSRVQELTAELLHELFASHPMNTCQPSHIEPILSLYRGTLSTCDLHLLSIFQLFESQRAASIGTLISRWSSAAGLNQSASPLRAVQSLDSTMTFRTCLSFPRTRQLTGYRQRSRNDGGQSIYDPVFVMLLLSRALQVEPPSSATGWVELFRTNVVSLLIAALAAKHTKLREVAVNLLATLRATLEVRS